MGGLDRSLHIAWTDTRIDLLTQFWRDGLSASQIAQRLGGVTRNAVIGKVHRLGLSGRATPSKPRRLVERVARPRRPARPARAAASVRTLPVRLADEAPGAATPLTLGAHMCKWPIGDPKLDTFTFCGRAVPGDGPYCREHAAVAYQPRPARDDDLARTLRRHLG